MLQAGDRVPHFDVTTLDGSRATYSAIWQRKNLVLLVLPAPDAPDAHLLVPSFASRAPDLADCDAVVIITADRISGAIAPAILIADRWGEIRFVDAPATIAGLPSVDTVVERLRSVDHECPECQGEVR